MEAANTEVSQTDIAIIGMSGRFPGAKTISEFWENLYAGRETLSRFTEAELSCSGIPRELLENKNYIRVGSILPDYNKFDNEFFNISPRDSLLLDPQYRLFLEESWTAFENAGYDILNTKQRVGVFAGAKPSNYLNYYQDITNDKITNLFEYGFYNEISQLATRVSYEFNLNGPSVYILTACSSSLVAIHLACQNLLVGECDIALAGAISLQAPQIAGYIYQNGMILSADGHCRPFDANATGTILSNGMGIIVLKRLIDALKDGDRIEAVIKATAINNDGKRKVGFTAPSVEGQAEVISTAISLSGIDPNTISYVEAHGTGTQLGDPIELLGLKKAFSEKVGPNYRCHIGSVKSNIGHLDVAAGMAGVIKTIKSMQAKKIPATLHFQEPNPGLKIQESPFVVTNKLTDWLSSDEPLRAGISSFGIGGTNAHIILEEAPKDKLSDKQKTTHVLILSAKNKESLGNLKKNFAEYLKNNTENLSDIAYTMQLGRHHFSYRFAIAFRDNDDVIKKLQDEVQDIIQPKRELQKIVFMFPGQGSQYVNMGYELYNEYELFRNLVDTCINKINKLIDFDIHKIIFPNFVDNLSEAALMQTEKAQLALFTIEYALAQFLILLGINPTIMVGHSLGEYVAATLAGVFSLDDALRLVYKRSQLMQTTQPGSMLAVFIDEKTLNLILPSDLSLAAINSKNLCVVSGLSKHIEIFSKKLKDENIKSMPLKVSHAFHSILMEPILGEFKSYLNSIVFSKPKIPYISNLTGRLITDEEATSPDYWVNHLRYPVKYYEGFSRLVQDDSAIYIEIGPGTALSSLAISEFKLEVFNTLSSKNKVNKVMPILETLGNLWQSGFLIDFARLYMNEKRRKLALPTYQFLRKEFWPIKSNSNSIIYSNTRRASIESTQLEEIKNSPIDVSGLLENIWTYYFDKKAIDNNIDIFSAGADSLTAIRLLDYINREFQLDLPISWIYRHQNFSAQLEAITAANYSVDNLLVVFSKVENSIPLIFIHPSRAGAEVYQEIASKIGKNRTVIGINSYCLNTGDYGFNSIESLADMYIEKINRLCSSESFFLAGWSMGGLIAYQMAKKLNQSNRSVLGLYLIDTAVTTESSYFSQTLIETMKKELITTQQFIEYPKKLQNKLLKQVEVDTLLMKTYQDYERYTGFVVLYKAKNSICIENPNRLSITELKEINTYFFNLFKDQSNGWNKYVPNLTVVPIDACHFSILNKLDLVEHIQNDLNSRGDVR